MTFPLLGSLFSLLLFLTDLQAEHHHELELDLGEVAPEFMAIDQDGHLWKTSDLVGKKNLVIYFYPFFFPVPSCLES